MGPVSSRGFPSRASPVGVCLFRRRPRPRSGRSCARQTGAAPRREVGTVLWPPDSPALRTVCLALGPPGRFPMQSPTWVSSRGTRGGSAPPPIHSFPRRLQGAGSQVGSPGGGVLCPLEAGSLVGSVMSFSRYWWSTYRRRGTSYYSVVSGDMGPQH